MDAKDKQGRHSVSVPTTSNDRQSRSKGEGDAFAHLLPLVSEELRRLEQRYVNRERSRNAGQPSALVTGSLARRTNKHGAITGGTIGNRFIDQKHFFTVCARQMRRILFDHAQANAVENLSEPAANHQADSGIPATGKSPVLELDRALTDFEQIDPAASLAFELYYFGGHDYKELAIITKVSEVSAQRQLRLARAWLLARMQAP
jgi:RNA polymerase sigma factor (TIGR02999 family)